jgi:hypothetical protein
MEKMYVSFVKDLRNYEFISLFSNLNRLLAKVTIDDDYLQKRIERIKYHDKQLLQLKPATSAHPLTAVINEKVATRTKYLARLRMRIESDLLSNIPEERVAAERLTYWYNRYKKNLHKPSITIQNNLIRGMMQERDQEPEIKEATTILGLNSMLEETLQLTEEITKHDLDRLRDETHFSTVIKGLRKEAYKDLKHLVNAIEPTFSSITKEEEKEEMILLNAQINSNLRYLRTKQRSRITKSKNKREIAAVVEELIETTHKPAPAQINIPMVNYNELKLFDKRKATTTNPSQQTLHENTTLLKSSEKDRKTNTKPNSKKELNNSNATVRDKNKEDNNKLPPIGKN